MRLKIFLPALALYISFAQGHVKDNNGETFSTLIQKKRPASVNVLLGDAQVHANREILGEPVSLRSAVLSKSQNSDEPVAKVLQDAVTSSRTLKEQEALENQEHLDREENERDATRRLEVAEAEKALNLAIERDLHDKHELHDKEEKLRHLRRKDERHQTDLRKNEAERLSALEDEETQLEEEDISLKEAEKRAEEDVEDLKENLDEVVEQEKEKEKHDIKKAINTEKKKHLRFIQRHENSKEKDSRHVMRY